MIDFSPFFSQLFSAFWWLLLLPVIAALFKQLKSAKPRQA
jgi:hypothetical protein